MALVLVVDDDPDVTELVQAALEEAGHQVTAAVGAGALRAAHELHPDVILLDLMMPGMDGIEVSRRLRANPVTAHIPIVVMSAQDPLRAAGPLLPVNDRLPKPFALAALYATVARWARAS